jgi:hypothetical protein
LPFILGQVLVQVDLVAIASKLLIPMQVQVVVAVVVVLLFSLKSMPFQQQRFTQSLSVAPKVLVGSAHLQVNIYHWLAVVAVVMVVDRDQVLKVLVDLVLVQDLQMLQAHN